MITVCSCTCRIYFFFNLGKYFFLNTSINYKTRLWFMYDITFDTYSFKGTFVSFVLSSWVIIDAFTKFSMVLRLMQQDLKKIINIQSILTLFLIPWNLVSVICKLAKF